MRKKVPANLSSWEKLRKLDAVKINTFTEYFSQNRGTMIRLAEMFVI
jgi:hypothetical protein